MVCYILNMLQLMTYLKINFSCRWSVVSNMDLLFASKLKLTLCEKKLWKIIKCYLELRNLKFTKVAIFFLIILFSFVSHIFNVFKIFFQIYQLSVSCILFLDFSDYSDSLNSYMTHFWNLYTGWVVNMRLSGSFSI